ncbi:peptidylprolyl isomerase [Paraburkholderia agricolaris]|uniref:peptidylprolyl isomerase n=1 Tax=Paraburkholderia agricolaris TaxID=2152888 RepID=UPI001FE7E033|nr:peptidylprolyl isomerase [Paraburkholderia agricolaris]
MELLGMKRNFSFTSRTVIRAVFGFCLVTSATVSAQAIADSATTATQTPMPMPMPTGTVAIVNNVAIPQAKLDEAVLLSRQPDTPQLRKTLTSQLIALELFRQEAEKQHYGTKLEVKQAMDAAKANTETALFLKENVRAEPVTDLQVKAQYDRIVASLGKDEYKPRIILVADDAAAALVLGKLKSGVAFDQLAREYSIAPSKSAGGELAWVSLRMPLVDGQTQGMPLPIAQALVQLPPGGVTPVPIVVDNARVLIKLDAKRPTEIPAFDQAKAAIRQQLQAVALEKAAANLVAGLLKDARIQQ